MRRDNLLEIDNLVDRIAVAAFVVERFERFGNIPFLHIADDGVVGRLQLVLLKIRGAAVRIGQQAAGNSRRTILRIGFRSVRERDGILDDQGADAIETVESLDPVLGRVGRLDQDVTRIEHVAFASNQLDDVKAVGRLHDLRNLSYLEGHRRIGEGGPEDGLREHTQFATLAHAARIL